MSKRTEWLVALRTRTGMLCVLLVAIALWVGVWIGRRGAGAEGATQDASPAEGAHQVTGASQVWTCSMHPQIRQNEPGKCPICGMDLIAASGNEGRPLAADQVVLSERAKVLARLRTTEVRRRSDPSTELRLLGRIEPAETSARTVTAWVAGRIERLHVRVTGSRVSAGQVIAEIYSPELFTAHQDLRAAQQQVARLAQAGDMARTAARAAFEAARERLRLLGIRGEQLAELEAAAEPLRNVGIRSPFSGTVIERLASEGAYVAIGEPLYRIANLARVWVQLDAYERDLPLLQVGQRVHIQLDARPSESIEGSVAFIEPTVDPERRIARVRVETDNPDGELRPGMFVQAVVQAGPKDVREAPLVIPKSAPLFTGPRSIVYVQLPNTERPTYEAREVRLGPRSNAGYPVISGLREGERVVTRGAFVLDADLQIRGGQSMMMRPVAEPVEPELTLTAAQQRTLRPVLEAYLQLQHALSLDEREGAVRAATALLEQLRQVRFDAGSRLQQLWAPIGVRMQAAAARVAESESLEGMRGPFEVLSVQLVELLRRVGNPADYPVRMAHCPMASGVGIWLQRGESIENPYFGHSMRSCGDFRERVGPNEHLPQSSAGSPAPEASHRGHEP